ncbi:MAG: hypothetical protein SWY16_13375 [Cyanobacteriota bacterium]|nr:hypothetical protein [Cyanobacteriota bacterium]
MAIVESQTENLIKLITIIKSASTCQTGSETLKAEASNIERSPMRFTKTMAFSIT